MCVLRGVGFHYQKIYLTDADSEGSPQSVMGHPGIQMGTWTLCVFLSLMCVGQVVAGP